MCFGTCLNFLLNSVEANFLQCAVCPRDAVAAAHPHKHNSSGERGGPSSLPSSFSYFCVCAAIGGGCYDFSVCGGSFFHWKSVFFPDHFFVFHFQTTFLTGDNTTRHRCQHDSRFLFKKRPLTVCVSLLFYLYTKCRLFSLECKHCSKP